MSRLRIPQPDTHPRNDLIELLTSGDAIRTKGLYPKAGALVAPSVYRLGSLASGMLERLRQLGGHPIDRKWYNRGNIAMPRMRGGVREALYLRKRPLS